jgi:uncharacterized protein (TIGR03032 family)
MTVLAIDNCTRPIEPAVAPSAERVAPPQREVRHEYTHSLPPLLSQLGVSLLVSTYQAGKVVAVGVAENELTLSYHNFEKAMGLAVKPDRIAAGTRAQIWFLRSAPDLASRVEPAGRHDACFLTRSSHFTGEVQVHELAWSGDELWLVNTAFSCLCTLDDRHSFVPRWRPPFISGLAAGDRCHLNGMAMAPNEQGVPTPRYVTALAETDTPQGWRPNKGTSGCLIDVASGQTVARGFAMPHSPRVHGGRVWLLHSGAGQLVLVDPAKSHVQTVAELPGYTRGLALYDRYAFVGLSKIRETSTFGGMPIAARRPELKCGVGVVDLTNGRLIAHLEFVTGVEEIFDVQVVPGARCLALSGPDPSQDNAKPIWTAPSPALPSPPGRGAGGEGNGQAVFPSRRAEHSLEQT